METTAETNVNQNENSEGNFGIKTTSNQLHDVIEWLKMGHNVVLQNNDKSLQRVFFGDPNADNTYDKATIIVTCVSVPGILDDGEWNWYIENAGFTECKATTENVDDINKKINAYSIFTFNS